MRPAITIRPCSPDSNHSSSPGRSYSARPSRNRLDPSLRRRVRLPVSSAPRPAGGLRLIAYWSLLLKVVIRDGVARAAWALWACNQPLRVSPRRVLSPTSSKKVTTVPSCHPALGGVEAKSHCGSTRSGWAGSAGLGLQIHRWTSADRKWTGRGATGATRSDNRLAEAVLPRRPSGVLAVDGGTNCGRPRPPWPRFGPTSINPSCWSTTCRCGPLLPRQRCPLHGQLRGCSDAAAIGATRPCN